MEKAESTGSNRKRKQHDRYEEYITRKSAAAAAVGRREPYHLTYIRRYGNR